MAMSIYEIAKHEFEKQYDSVFTLSVNEPVRDGAITKDKWVEKISDQPCRVSKKQINPASDGMFADATYQTTLYCDPQLDIPAGSKFTVTDVHGNVKEYSRASAPFNGYRTHQEIVLIREVKA